MKKFTIVHTSIIEEYVTYTVEAETEEEAMAMIEDGDVDDNDDHWQENRGDSGYHIDKVEVID